MTRYRATLAYDGTAYQGFQRQAGETPTVQRAVEQSIGAVCGEAVTVIAAGRTDTGVHATGQVIAFDVNWSHAEADLLRAINANLPNDVALQAIRQAEGFHPRFDARARCYRYTVLEAAQHQPLWRDFAWRVREPLNVEVMNQAAAMLIGEHDFAAFGQPPQGTNTVREVFLSHWRREAEPFGARLTYEIEGTAFLQHMVRRVVGTLVEVGRGRLSEDAFLAIFQSRDLSRVKVIAPPGGLVLVRVRYDEDFR